MPATAARSSTERFFPARVPRPSNVGTTHILDRLGPQHAAELDYLAPFIDIAKIGWGLPLLLPRDTLRKRVRAYHQHSIEVCTGGTLLEYAVANDRVREFLDDARGIGFDAVEISTGVVDLAPSHLERLARAAAERGLSYFLEVGRKDPHYQLSLKETITHLSHARSLRPRKVIVASGETGRGVGIYENDGSVKWGWVRSILAEHPLESLIFEAPQESQQVQLVRELGPGVNLGHVALPSVAVLASERLGLGGEASGPARLTQPVKGPPATKFLVLLLERYRSLDPTQMVKLSRLPRRTVRNALDLLLKQGIVKESVSLEDSRRREYRLR
jgi:phosphosulfolactate synthase